MQNSFKIIYHNQNNKEFLDEITLSYEDRFIRRKKLIANNAYRIMVYLMKNDIFYLEMKRACLK